MITDNENFHQTRYLNRTTLFINSVFQLAF
jgi:hypothetical protein